MAVLPSHILMTFHGSLSGGESWTCGIRTTQIDESILTEAAPLLAVGIQAANAMQIFRNAHIDFWGGVDSIAGFTGVTVRGLNQAGITIGQAEASPTGTNAGISATVKPHPNQCAVVVTLETDRAGRTGKGRIYLPLIGIPVLGGKLQSTSMPLIASGMAGVLQAINTGLDANFPDHDVAVQSAKAFATDGASYTGAAIVGVKVGDTYDTQRRRRNNMIEQYSSAVV